MRSPVILFIIACLAIYMSNGRPHAEMDCVPAPYTAWSIVRHGSVDVRYYPALQAYMGCIIKLQDGSCVTRYPLGSSLIAVPFVAPLAAFHEQPPDGNRMLQIGKLVGALCVACGAGLFFLTCRRMAPNAAWAATILFAFGTCMFSVASQALWMHGPATFWLCCALYFLTREKDAGHNAALAGFALGLAVMTRPSTAFFAMATWLALLQQRRWRPLWGLMLGGLVPLVFICVMNWSLFGNLVKGGYIYDRWNEPPPFWLGFFGLLIAPSRGVLVYSPALLLLPLGIRQLFRRGEGPRDESRMLLLAWLLASAATLVFYAHWWDWSGEWSYGPRFLCETMPALCMVFALGYEKLRSTWSRRVAWGLIALSIMVHAAGVFGNKAGDAWHERHQRDDQGLSLFELHDTQIGQQMYSMMKELTGKFTKKPQPLAP